MTGGYDSVSKYLKYCCKEEEEKLCSLVTKAELSLTKSHEKIPDFMSCGQWNKLPEEVVDPFPLEVFMKRLNTVQGLD